LPDRVEQAVRRVGVVVEEGEEFVGGCGQGHEGEALSTKHEILNGRGRV
jgi:hypothetical protein